MAKWPAATGEVVLRPGAGDQYIVPPEDIDLMQVNLPEFKRGIGGGFVSLNNIGGFFNDKFSKFDKIRTDIWRIGESQTAIILGRIIKPEWLYDYNTGERLLKLYFEDYAQELLAPPSLPIKSYKAVNGKAIIDDEMLVCNELTLDATDNGSEIGSAHDMEIEEQEPYNVITEVMGIAQAQGTGITGFDGYVDALGKLHIFKRGKYTSAINMAGKFIGYTKSEDVHRVRNRIYVYGAAERTYPANMYDWTESLTPADGDWFQHTGQILQIVAGGELGSYYINHQVTSPDYYGRFYFVLDNGKEINCHDKSAFQTLNFSIWIDKTVTGLLTVILTDDAGKNAATDVGLMKKEAKEDISIPVGFLNKKEWSGGDTFNWRKVKRIDWVYSFSGSGFQWYIPVVTEILQLIAPTSGGNTGGIGLDNVYFGNARFNVMVENAASQGLYRARSKRITDDKLKSYDECIRRGTQELAELKNPVTLIQGIKVEGDYYKPGYKQSIVTPDFTMTQTILEVVHTLEGTRWEAELITGEA